MEAPEKPEPPEKSEPWWANGASWHGLAEARDDLDHARRRYAEAVRGARAAGFSWGEIGRVLGVSKQSLHRRFGDVGRVD